MPASVALKTPSYRHHKPSGQAVVTLSGKDFYLGRHGSPESLAEYGRRVGEWMAGGRRLDSAASDLTINELLVAYLEFADGYYRKNGKPTPEPAGLRLSFRPLRKLYGHTLAGEFGPSALKAVRECMIDSGLCRPEINRRIGKIIRAVKWGVESELISPSILHGLKAVPGLKRGRTEAREPAPVRPVPDAFVDPVAAPSLPPSVGDGRIAEAHGDAAGRGLHHADLRPRHVGPNLALHARDPQDGTPTDASGPSTSAPKPRPSSAPGYASRRPPTSSPRPRRVPIGSPRAEPLANPRSSHRNATGRSPIPSVLPRIATTPVLTITRSATDAARRASRTGIPTS